MFPVIAEEQSMLALWSVMNHTALVSAAQCCIVVSHAALFFDPVGTITDLARHLELEFEPIDLQQFVAETFKPDLNRSSLPPYQRVNGLRKTASTVTVDSCWQDIAAEYFFRLSRSRAAVQLMTAAELREIADGQSTLSALLPLLPAVQASISRLRSPPVEVQRVNARNSVDFNPYVVKMLRQFVWGFGRALDGSASIEELREVRNQVVAMVEMAPRDLAVLIALSRLERVLGDTESANRWLSVALSSFPDSSIPKRLHNRFVGPSNIS